MLQVIHNLRTGETSLETVPVPFASNDELLLRSRCSLVSLGTEKMLIDFVIRVNEVLYENCKISIS